jgi:hypothetical protein
MQEPLATVLEEHTPLPESEQVSRGQELMRLLSDQTLATSSEIVNKRKIDSSNSVDTNWNVVVKRGFIEVVIPSFEGRRKRAMSDSAVGMSENLSKMWKSISSEELDLISEASTDVSTLEDEVPLPASSESEEVLSPTLSEGEAETDARITPAWSYQYQAVPQQADAQSWWWPMGYEPSSVAMCSNSYTSLNPAAVSFTPSSFQSVPWADQSMDVAQCAGLNAEDSSQEWRTTVMIRNMPNNYTRDMLLELVDSMGFAGTYDFAYLPIDFQSQAGLGYAFLNFSSVADALRCFERFEGFLNWKVPSEKVCTVTWSSPTQGFTEHIERYRNSPVMHHSLPDMWKPILLQNGVRVVFPPPSKPIKTPKVRQPPPGRKSQA